MKITITADDGTTLAEARVGGIQVSQESGSVFIDAIVCRRDNSLRKPTQALVDELVRTGHANLAWGTRSQW